MRWSWVVAIACGCGRIDFDPGDVDAGLILHVTFAADVLTDTGPYHLVGTCADACPTLVAGHVGTGAAAFSSASAQCIAFADAPELHPEPFSFAFWMTTVDPTGNAAVLARPQQVSGATDVFAVLVDYDLTNFAAYVGMQMVNGGSYAPGWNHIAVTFDGSIASTYVAGQLTNTMSASPQAYGSSPLLIGCSRDNGNLLGFFDGELDDFRLYDRVLATSEIAALAAE